MKLKTLFIILAVIVVVDFGLCGAKWYRNYVKAQYVKESLMERVIVYERRRKN